MALNPVEDLSGIMPNGSNADEHSTPQTMNTLLYQQESAGLRSAGSMSAPLSVVTQPIPGGFGETTSDTGHPTQKIGAPTTAPTTAPSGSYRGV